MQETGSHAVPANPRNEAKEQNTRAKTKAKAKDRQGPMAKLTKGFGPLYTLRRPDGTEILQVHQDLARTGVWRVSYPDGRSAPHFGIDRARHQARRELERLGYVNNLESIVS